MSDTPPPFRLDRAIQKALLLEMRDAYPGSIWEGSLPSAEVLSNARYLAELELCTISSLGEPYDGRRPWNWATITAKGLDFLEDDGGYSAILGTVNVKLHADTIRDLIAAKVASSDLPKEKVSLLLGALKSVSDQGMRAATTDLVQEGLKHLPLEHLLRLFGVG